VTGGAEVWCAAAPGVGGLVTEVESILVDLVSGQKLRADGRCIVVCERWILGIGLDVSCSWGVREQLIVVPRVIGVPRAPMPFSVPRNEFGNDLCMMSVFVRHHKRLGFLIVMLHVAPPVLQRVTFADEDVP
jgi:hypothetical protein